jgi:hypothetical protein
MKRPGVCLPLGLSVMMGLAAVATARTAGAGCMAGALQQLHAVQTPAPATSAAPSSRAAATNVPLVYRPDAGSGSLVKADYEGGYDEGIVGLWQFQFRVGGTLVDWGTQAWHSDGTELTFSAGQNPETGDVCQGVWRKVGPNTFTLNHIAMGWAAPGASWSAPVPGFGVRVHFHFRITLNPSGTAFTGTFSQTVYAETPADPFNETTAPMLGPVTYGTVTATRIIPD